MIRIALRVRPGKSQAALVVTIILLLAVVGGLIWFLNRSPDHADETANEPTISLEDLNLAVAAVASAEDLQFEQALEFWQQLGERYPEVTAFQINEAVTVLKWIEVTNNSLSSGAVQDPTERAQLEGALDQAYSRADRVVDELVAVQDAKPSQVALLQAALLEAKARRLPMPEDEQVRLQAVEVIRNALLKEPAQPVLAAKFDEIILPLSTQASELSQQNADFLYAAWQAEPRNLFLLSRAADTLLKNNDSRLLELLEPSLELTQSMRAEVERDMRSLKLDQLIPQVRAAVEAGQWRQAIQLKRWLNVLKGMSGFRSDLRLVKPDVLALLETDFLNEFSQQARDSGADQAKSLIDGVSLAISQVEVSASAVAWFDYDLDLDFDLIVLRDRQLAMHAVEDGEIATEASQVIELDAGYQGCLIAEFFTVDDTGRNRKPASVAELMEQTDVSSQASATPSTEQVQESNRHDTYQEVLMWGDTGIEFVVVESPGDNDSDSESAASPAPVQLARLQAETGLEEVTGVLAAAVADIESDGDLDLLISTREGLRLFQNNGNRSFEDISEFSDLSQAPAGIESIVSGDVDADLDQDALLVSPQSDRVFLLENILHSQFRVRPLDEEWTSVTQPASLAIGDFDGNASWDFAVASDSGTMVFRTRTPQPGVIASSAIDNFDWPGQCVALGDLNNDGFEDILVGGSQGMAIQLGEGAGRFSPAMPVPDATQTVSQIAVVDANRDGVQDVAIVDGGMARVLWGEPSQTNYLAVRLRGINDINGGGRINHYSIGSTLEVWSDGWRQRRIVSQPTTHFGLGNDSAANLRVVFNNGLTQNVERPPVNTLVEEKQELKGSCPFVYGWDGERFVLITDTLWNAPLGLQTSRGQVLPDRRWENLLLPGEFVQPKDGAYELRFTEELWEVAYVDTMQLIAVDHPADVRVFTNEKVGPAEIAEHRVFGFAAPIYPVSAVDTFGRDVLPRVTSLDRDYVQAFDSFVHQGLVEPHFVELAFESLPKEDELFLCLSGWMYPTDTSLNIGISQNPERKLPEPPSLWVPDENGGWRCVRPFVGFPGGKPKSIVIGLNDVFSNEDYRLRIAASQQIYWDDIFIAVDDPSGLVTQPTVLDSAELSYRGFSHMVPRKPDQPHWYDYEQVSKEAKWPELSGPFTRFGNVRQLLSDDDDRLVVMTSGDEIILRFKAPPQPLPDGWRRDFVLHSTGWDKDADINTLAGQSSLPLPFMDQSRYPPGVEDVERAEQVWKMNADTLTRQRQVRPAQSRPF